MAGLASLVVVLQSAHVSNVASAVVFGPGIGWAFIATGLFAWSRRPDNQFGGLMTSVGFAWCAGALAVADEHRLFVAGALLSAVPYALLVHMLLAFPDGRLAGRFDRLVVGASYASCTLGQWLPLLVFETQRLDCECARQSLLVPSDPDAERLVFAAQAVVALLIAAGIVAALVRRARGAGGVRAGELRSLAPIGALVATLLVTSMLARIDAVPDALRDAVRVVALAGFLLIPFAFLAGLLRARLSRAAALTRLVSRLAHSDGAAAGVRDALADALDDPGLALAYWIPDQRRYVDGAGQPVELVDDGGGRRWTAIERDGRPIAAIAHVGADDEAELIRAAGAAAALTLENERLAAELRAHVEELQASRARVVQAGLAERRRLERDLHDGAQQRLVSLAFTLGLARSRARDHGGVTELLESADGQLQSALEELRELARGIHPPVLSDRGLGGALEALASRAPLPVQIVSAPTERLPEPLESAVYFTVAEALTNAARHARASHATVHVAHEDGELLVEVSDDGVGGADTSRGSGLRGLGDRLGALGGRLSVSSPPGNGTTIRGSIPCA